MTTETNTPRPCPDCDAEQRVTPVRVGGRETKLIETIHADACPTLRGVIR